MSDERYRTVGPLVDIYKIYSDLAIIVIYSYFKTGVTFLFANRF